MIVDKIAGVVGSVLVQVGKGVKGSTEHVLFSMLPDVIEYVLKEAECTPKDVYENIVKGTKPFVNLPQKEVVLYYAALGVIKEVVGLLKEADAEKEGLVKELELAKIVTVVDAPVVGSDVAIDWSHLQPGGKPIK